MRDRKTNCWPPYDDPPKPDSDRYAAELGNALKVLDTAWDHATGPQERERVDDVRSEIRGMLLNSIHDTDTEENDEV